MSASPVNLTAVLGRRPSRNSDEQHMGALRAWFLLIDLGFIVYWAISLGRLLPPEAMYADYDSPILRDWNYSFLPLDLLISATGLTAVRLARRDRSQWRPVAIISLVLTSVSGLQAIAFWTLRGDWNPSWWLPNLVLLVYPLLYLPRLVRELPSAAVDEG